MVPWMLLVLLLLLPSVSAYYGHGVQFINDANYTVNLPFSASNLTLEASQLLIDGSVFDEAAGTNNTIYVADNCSSYGTESLRFQMLNETDDSAVVNGTMEAHLWVRSGGYSEEYNLTWTGFNNSVCIVGNLSTFSVDIQVEYTADGYGAETYYADNLNLTATLQTYDLLLSAGTTDVVFTVKDQYDDVVSDIIIEILEYDIGDDAGVLTQSIKTNDDGEAIGKVILSNKRYKFLLKDNGVLILETDPVILTLTSYTFRVYIGGNYFENYDYTNDIACSVTRSGQTYEYTFSDPNAQITQGCLTITLRTPMSDRVINNSCVVGTTGSISKNAYTVTGSYTIFAQGTYILDGQEYFCAQTTFSDDSNADLFGTEGIFMTFFVVLTLAMIGIWSPAASIVLSIIAIIASVIFGIFTLSTPALMIIVVLGILAIMRINKGN